MSALVEVAGLIKKLKSALIFCHINPDGDTLSSAFALKRALTSLEINAEIVSPDGIPEKYLKTGYFGQVLTEVKSGYDGYIAVDCSSEGQMGAPYVFFRRQKLTFNIDHHIGNTRYARYNYVCDEGANAINVYNLIKCMGCRIDELLANTLLLGIITDTGNFAHSNVNARVFKAAYELTEKGANQPQLYTVLYKSQPLPRAKLHAEVMSAIEFYENNKIALITISRKMLEKYGLTKSDTEGFIDFPMSIKDVEVGLSLFENSKELYKISFRSKNVNVNEIAGYFGGGGHFNASGAVIAGSIEEVKDKLVSVIKRYL